MRSLSRVELIGRLGADCEFRYTPGRGACDELLGCDESPDVLNQGELGNLPVGERLDDGRDGLKLGELTGAPAALSSDKHVVR